jgi:hypothetical protein
MQNRFNIFVDDHSVPLDIFLHLPNYRTQDIRKIIPTNLVLAASDLCQECLKSDGQQFHQRQENEQSHRVQCHIRGQR